MQENFEKRLLKNQKICLIKWRSLKIKFENINEGRCKQNNFQKTIIEAKNIILNEIKEAKAESNEQILY